MARHLLSALGLKSKLAEAVRLAADEKSVQRIGDGDGLMLVVRPSGEASWVLRYRQDGGRRDCTIGRWPAVTLALARAKADELRRQVAAGVDPMAEKAKRPPPRSTDTVRKLADDWIGKLNRSAVYLGNIEAALKKDVMPAIGAKPPQDVTREDCLKILRGIEDREAHVLVRRVRMWMRQMFEFGIDDESRPLLTTSPVPMGTLRSFARRDAGHFPAVTDAERVGELMWKIRGCTNWVNRVALLFSAYTFQRPTEIREATWDEIDLHEARWRIPASRMKLNREHWVPLATQAVELLRQHAGVIGERGWVFPGRRYGKPISEGTLGSALNAMGFAGEHSPHGFRAMARTLGEEVLDIAPRFLEKQLAHEHDVSGLRGAYNRGEYWKQRVEMMQRWADWVDEQAASWGRRQGGGLMSPYDEG